MGQQYLAEGVSYSVHHGLVKVAVASEAGDITVLFTFETFFSALREAVKFAKRADTDHRSRVTAFSQGVEAMPDYPPD